MKMRGGIIKSLSHDWINLIIEILHREILAKF